MKNQIINIFGVLILILFVSSCSKTDIQMNYVVDEIIEASIEQDISVDENPELVILKVLSIAKATVLTCDNFRPMHISYLNDMIDEIDNNFNDIYENYESSTKYKVHSDYVEKAVSTYSKTITEDDCNDRLSLIERSIYDYNKT